MTLEQAKQLIGNQDTVALRNMIRALELPVSQWMNTAQDRERLAAAKLIVRDRAKRGIK